MYAPPLLKSGDKVAIVAPSAKPEKLPFEKGAQVIVSWGLDVELGKYAFDQHSQYLAAPDDKRLDDLQSMLNRPDIKAIFCARGGYGANRIIDRLDFDLFLKYPKWVVGFSDVTAIHLKIHQLGIESLHACMPVQFAQPEYRESIERIQSLLFTSNQAKIEAKPHHLNKTGRAQGQLVGGNLSLVVDALETAASLNTAGKILILEEVGEPLYKIDRMMNHLKRAGKLDQLAGLIFAQNTHINVEKSCFDETLEEIVLNKTSDFSYPVAFGFPIGHSAPNWPWYYSAAADFEVTISGSEVRF